MERKVTTAELAGFFQREVKDKTFTLSDAHRMLEAGADQRIDPQRVGHLLDEITKLIREYGPETLIGDFLPEEPSTLGGPGTHG